jgi:hypothetical protein
MSLSLVIAINVVAMLALLGGLAWFMSHPRRLTPHRAAHELTAVERLHGERFEQSEERAA